MLAQIVVQTNAHPYHLQVASFFASVAPVVTVLALIIVVQIIQLRRGRPRHTHQQDEQERDAA